MRSVIDNAKAGRRPMSTFFYGGEPGLARGDLVLPTSAAAPHRIASGIATCPLGKFFIADDVASALFLAVLQMKEPLALYQVSPLGEIEAVRDLANSVRSFIGLGVLKLCKQAQIVNEVELDPGLILHVREMVSTPEKSIPNFAERSASARRENNLADIRKDLKGDTRDARGAFLKKQARLRRAKARGKK